MAEQSMFWPTTGTGDGISGGYTDARLKTIWKAALGNGVLQYLNKLEATGTGTSTLAVNTGAALVEGYLYENDSSASIATTSLGSATYGLYVIANEDASALAVSRSVAGTTVAAKSTRLALNSTTPTQPYIKIATVVTSGGSITSITAENNRFASSRVKTVGSSTLATGSAATAQTFVTATSATVVLGTVTNSDYVTINSATGVITIKESGVYAINVFYAWAYNATGERFLYLNVNSAADSTTFTNFLASSISFGTNTTRNVVAYQRSFSAGDTVEVIAEQRSGGNLNLNACRVNVARLG